MEIACNASEDATAAINIEKGLGYLRDNCIEKWGNVISPRRIHNLYLKACGRVGLPEHAERAIKYMRRCTIPNGRCPPNQRSYRRLIRACANAGEPQRAAKWLERVLSGTRGVTACGVMYSLVIKAYANTSDLASARLWFTRLQASGLPLDGSLRSFLPNEPTSSTAMPAPSPAPTPAPTYRQTKESVSMDAMRNEQAVKRAERKKTKKAAKEARKKQGKERVAALLEEREDQDQDGSEEDEQARAEAARRRQREEEELVRELEAETARNMLGRGGGFMNGDNDDIDFDAI
uniref:Pentacotripeptide-repeat region of PRORP domain-containing protein n=1 Tax=Lotharella globosa TaxID=91324 RepID=A0A7S3ZC69_9EUKA